MLRPCTDTQQARTEPTRGSPAAAPLRQASPTPEQMVVQALKAAAGGALVLDEPCADDPQTNLERDAHLLDSLDVTACPILRLWRNRRCLVASRSQARSPQFPRVSALSAASGWPVAVRRSGGTAVVHGPGVLNVSYFEGFPAGKKPPTVTWAYDRLLGLLIDAMARLGLHCDHGEVAGACCDGKYNLRWQGRKLAGTAGFLTRRHGVAVSVFHASIAIDGSAQEEVHAVQRFERALGKPGDYREQAHVSVAEILSAPQPPITALHITAGQQRRQSARSRS